MLDRVSDLSRNWPPDYAEIFQWRQKQLIWLREDRRRVYWALEYYRNNPIDFIQHWGITFDPRNAGTNIPTYLPFVLFQKQKELIYFLQDLLRSNENGLVEKSRDMGATWLCVAFSIWMWLFQEGAAIGWGSRKVDLVDQIGIVDSIFEKMRVFLRWIPPEFLPTHFRWALHTPYLRFYNPENGATIAGEGGDNFGRGGRKTIYFKDESAHYEHPEMIEAALTSNTSVQVDISSVHGLGNVFHRKREAGVEWYPGVQLEPGRTRIFIMDWRDHPAKTQGWYDRERQSKIDQGLAHIWAQEVDRSYSAAVIGTIIPAEWVRACIDAHVALGFRDDGQWGAALDVADEGLDTNALAIRKGVVLKSIAEWSAPDPAVTARKAIAACRDLCPIEIQYDCIGVGASVKGEGNRLGEENLLPRGLLLAPWNAGAGPLNPDKPIIPRDKQAPLNGDFYGNLKAQGWWQLRLRCERTWRARNDPSYTWDAEDLISFDSGSIPVQLLRKLEKELSQPTITQSSKLKLLVNKTPPGTKSPNLADAVMMCYWPVPTKKPMMISAAVLERALLPG